MADIDDVELALANARVSLAAASQSISNIAIDQTAILKKIADVADRVTAIEQRVAFAPVQLFGPIAGNGLTQPPVGEQWGFIGSALSASTKFFAFNLGYSHAASVRWVIIWTPNSTHTWARLVAFDSAGVDGLVNPIELGQIKSVGHITPTPEVLEVCAQFNALVDSKKAKQIGFQIVSDTDVTFYEVRLEINWQ